MVEYEWDLEEVDEYGDILDHDFQERLSNFGRMPPIDGTKYRLVLVRYVTEEAEGIVDQEWAYAIPQHGFWALPDRFDGGAKVPKRFKEELARARIPITTISEYESTGFHGV